ncbi:hypothetical protein N7931_00050 [Catenovulum sp. 2E275]|uniref:chondroitinase-B domain-containing protein n=1 Tax=Catenovulum sp. 2E275 TaxID=2980497 RepID=UPI0021D145B3|nr:chondroitinase-B domain-containing protein [Catenovulum sp. 2E275]MCU4674011.1 hypothetical protein [Catenovulum sp. 2E275]
MNKKLISISIATLLLSGCNGVYDDFEPANAKGTIQLTGEVAVGNELSVNVADADGISGSVSYTWMQDSEVINGLSGNTYQLSANDVGAYISVKAEYKDDSGNNESILIKTTQAVPEMISDGVVSITGIPDDGVIAFGTVLSAQVDDADGVESEISYKWFSNDVEIAGATTETYTTLVTDIGQQISVQAEYTDALGLVEMPISVKTNPIIDPASYSLTLSKSTDIILGDSLTATLSVADTTATYQWFADDTEISGATSSNYIVQNSDLEKTISVTVNYQNGTKALTETANDVVYSYVVKNGAELLDAMTKIAENDVVALASASGGSYADISDEVVVAVNGVKLTRTKDSSAVISGATCIALKANNLVIDGLVFENNDAFLVGAGSGDTECDSSSSTDAMLLMNGDNVVVKNSTFKDHTGTTGFNWIELKGTNSIIERNLFSGSDTDNDKSGAISIYIDPDIGKNESNIVQYNHFTNIKPSSSAHSGSYVIQLGRSTGDDSTGDGKHLIQYNLFDDIEVKERLIKVQGSNNTIKGNTILNSIGMISLEDGAFNTVESNIIISGQKSGGIGFSNLGHMISNNYVENDAYTGGDRGALFIHADYLDNSGNKTFIANYTESELKVVMNNNTIFNTAQAIAFDDKDGQCKDLSPWLDTTNNLIAAEMTNDNGAKSEATVSADFDSAGCVINSNSVIANNHFFVNALTDGGSVDFSTTSGGLDEAAISVNSQALISGTGAQSGIGADLTQLYKLSTTEVGPKTNWTFN